MIDEEYGGNIVLSEPDDEDPLVELPKDVLERLNPAKLRCIFLYLSGEHTLKKIAQIVGVAPSTVARYLRNPDAQIAMREIQQRDFARIEHGINSLQDKALNTMRDLMDSSMDNVRYQASKDILDRAGHKTANKVKVEKTVMNIEKQLSNLSNFTINEEDVIDIDVDEMLEVYDG